jgi:hypothetical protein
MSSHATPCYGCGRLSPGYDTPWLANDPDGEPPDRLCPTCLGRRAALEQGLAALAALALVALAFTVAYPLVR